MNPSEFHATIQTNSVVYKKGDLQVGVWLHGDDPRLMISCFDLTDGDLPTSIHFSEFVAFIEDARLKTKPKKVPGIKLPKTHQTTPSVVSRILKQG